MSNEPQKSGTPASPSHSTPQQNQGDNKQGQSGQQNQGGNKPAQPGQQHQGDAKPSDKPAQQK